MAKLGTMCMAHRSAMFFGIDLARIRTSKRVRLGATIMKVEQVRGGYAHRSDQHDLHREENSPRSKV